MRLTPLDRIYPDRDVTAQYVHSRWIGKAGTR